VRSWPLNSRGCHRQWYIRVSISRMSVPTLRYRRLKGSHSRVKPLHHQLRASESEQGVHFDSGKRRAKEHRPHYVLLWVKSRLTNFLGTLKKEVRVLNYRNATKKGAKKQDPNPYLRRTIIELWMI